jgi:hypothetical protein
VLLSHIALHVCLSPSVNYLPEWFPGGGFKKTAAEMRALRERFMNEPFDFVKKEIVGFFIPEVWRRLIIHGSRLREEPDLHIPQLTSPGRTLPRRKSAPFNGEPPYSSFLEMIQLV